MINSKHLKVVLLCVATVVAVYLCFYVLFVVTKIYTVVKLDGSGFLAWGNSDTFSDDNESLIRRIRKWTRVPTEIHVSGRKLTPSEIRLIGRWKTVKSIMLEESDYSPKEITTLLQNKSIESLGIALVDIGDFIKIDADLSKVELLVITNANIDEHFVRHINASSLKVMVVSECNLRESGLKVMNNISGLRSLSVRDCTVSYKAMPFAFWPNSLEIISFSNMNFPVSAFCGIVNFSPNMKGLVFSEVEFINDEPSDCEENPRRITIAFTGCENVRYATDTLRSIAPLAVVAGH